MNDGLVAACVQWLPTPGAFEENLDFGIELIDQAHELGADLVMLPELWISGYDTSRLGADIQASAEALTGGRLDHVAERARRHGMWIVAGSIAEASEQGIANTVTVFDRSGNLRATHRKQHLYPLTGEDTIFRPGPAVSIFEDDELGRVGLTVCFDGDFPSTQHDLRAAGVELVLQPNAYEVEAAAYWDLWYRAQAISSGQFWVMANQCGVNPSGSLLGASRIIDPTGAVITEAPRCDGSITPEACIILGELRKSDAVLEARAFAQLLT